MARGEGGEGGGGAGKRGFVCSVLWVGRCHARQSICLGLFACPHHPTSYTQPSQTAAAVVVASEEGAIAVLATDDPNGRIRWRHVLPSPSSSTSSSEGGVVVDVVVDEKGSELVLALSRCAGFVLFLCVNVYMMMNASRHTCITLDMYTHIHTYTHTARLTQPAAARAAAFCTAGPGG